MITKECSQPPSVKLLETPQVYVIIMAGPSEINVHSAILLTVCGLLVSENLQINEYIIANYHTFFTNFQTLKVYNANKYGLM